MEDHALRRNIILAKIEDRRLPHDTIPRVWGGPGRGEACDGCDETIPKAEYVMEGVGSKGDELRFHVKCFYIWASEMAGLNASREPAR